jgi:hypothetical protein
MISMNTAKHFGAIIFMRIGSIISLAGNLSKKLAGLND